MRRGTTAPFPPVWFKLADNNYKRYAYNPSVLDKPRPITRLDVQSDLMANKDGPGEGGVCASRLFWMGVVCTA